MTHPLRCPKCNSFRVLEYIGVRFEDDEKTKGFGVNVPFYNCPECGNSESVIPYDVYRNFQKSILPSMNPGEYVDMPLKFIVSQLDHSARFKQYDHLDLKYDPVDYYLIPGLYREWNDGYLTPVYFDKEVLLHYNNHPDYTVVLTSFSSGNILYKGKNLLSHGFGINPSGKLFLWLGDISSDFSGEEMKNHLKRFQASNIDSDHDIRSQFYLSQNPSSPSEMFQVSDNEQRIFTLLESFDSEFEKEHGIRAIKVDVDKLTTNFKPPILEEREQVFAAFLAFDKMLVENLQPQVLRDALLAKGIDKSKFQRNGSPLGSLKLLEMYLRDVKQKANASEIVSPLFVLNDLRQLHGHLSNQSFEDKFNSCKERLGLDHGATDLEVYETLVARLILMYSSFIA